MNVGVHETRQDRVPGEVDAFCPGKRAAKSATAPTATMRSPFTATAPAAMASRPVPSITQSAEISFTAAFGSDVMSDSPRRSAAGGRGVSEVTECH
jgi:hypothetical protein